MNFSEINFPEFDIRENILLIGSGFTKDFGGVLGEEIWQDIFNNSTIQNSKALRNKFKLNKKNEFIYDYETIYENVINDITVNDNDREIFINALIKIYQIKIDKKIQGKNHAGFKSLKNFIVKYFKGINSKKGFIFSLNQDLLLERHLHDAENLIFQYVGSDEFDSFKRSYIHNEIEAKQILRINKKTNIEKLSNNFINAESVLIKLHGSYNWEYSDGKRIIITGKSESKIKEINNTELLKWNYQLFDKVLKNKVSKKILIIGYGFKEDHINDCLAEAATSKTIKFYIISKQSLKEIMDSSPVHVKNMLRDHLAGYWNKSMIDIFPENGEETECLNELSKSLDTS